MKYKFPVIGASLKRTIRISGMNQKRVVAASGLWNSQFRPLVSGQTHV